MALILTNHARARMQQRGIPVAQLSWLEEFGTEHYDQAGKSWRFYDHKAKKIKFDTYGVIAEDAGAFVTVGHRTKRFNRH